MSILKTFRQPRCSLLIALAAAAAACTRAEGVETPRWARVAHSCSSSSPRRVLSPSELRDVQTSWVDSTGENAERAKQSRQTPGGWGGYFISSGRPTIYLTDTTQRAAAIAALSVHGVRGLAVPNDVVVKPARWSFAQLYDWYRYLTPKLSDRAVSGSGIDEAHNRLLYTVADRDAISRIEATLAALDVPCFLVAVEFMNGFPTPATQDQ